MAQVEKDVPTPEWWRVWVHRSCYLYARSLGHNRRTSFRRAFWCWTRG